MSINDYETRKINRLRVLVSEHNIPQEVHDVLYKLIFGRTESMLQEAWEAWQAWDDEDEVDDHDSDEFAEIVGDFLCRTVEFCGASDCDNPTFDTTYVGGLGEYVCASCLDNYTRCSRCDDYVSDTTTLTRREGYDREYCSSCFEEYASFCESCDTHYADCDSDEHVHQCECVAPLMHFDFPANGSGTVRQDTRLSVELPKGTIDEVGMERIQELVMRNIADPTRWLVPEVLAEVGPIWQKKQGNFTRRLSSALYKRGVKLASEVVSEVGNIARQHSTDTATWTVEFTRDLNQSAGYFYHEGSCWWQSYTASRCALKSWGGLGMRSFSEHSVSGRAWILPLDEDFEGTHDTINAHAYVVFNAYGKLDGYTAARIVAHLTGKSYKLIEFDFEVSEGETYINNEKGYLIADEAVCADTDTITMTHDIHDTRDNRYVQNRMASAS